MSLEQREHEDWRSAEVSARLAYRKGLTPQACPYLEFDPLRAAWVRAWYDEQRICDMKQGRAAG